MTDRTTKIYWYSSEIAEISKYPYCSFATNCRMSKLVIRHPVFTHCALWRKQNIYADNVCWRLYGFSANISLHKRPITGLWLPELCRQKAGWGWLLIVAVWCNQSNAVQTCPVQPRTPWYCQSGTLQHSESLSYKTSAMIYCRFSWTIPNLVESCVEIPRV